MAMIKKTTLFRQICLALLLALALQPQPVLCRNIDARQRRLDRRHGQGRQISVPKVEEQIVTSEHSRPISKNAAVGYGMLLALNSGYINGICLSGLLSLHGTKQASAAVTGAWTNSALGLANGNTEAFFFNAKCIFSYFFGSFTAGYINPNPPGVFKICIPAIRTLFTAGSILMFSSSVLCDEIEAGHTFLFLAAIANGIQNSVTSTTTANLVRSSHFSGITSDIGTFMGQVIRGNKTNLLKLQVFSALALCFWTGGYLSFNMVEAFRSSALLVSSALYMIMAISVGFL